MPGHADTAKTTLALSATAPLDGLFVQTLSGSEGMDMLFHVELACRSNDDALDLKGALGLHLTVTLGAGAAVRPLDGMCARIRQRPAEAGFAVYLVELRPWLWWLTLSSDNRIFQNKSVPDIVEAVFAGGGYTDYELQLSATYTPRDYCVQYGETDFAFVSRLLEEEGIHYFFRHQAGSHTLVLADSSDAYLPCPGAASVDFAPPDLGLRELQAIRSGEVVQEAVSLAFTGTDFAFATPATSLLATAEADAAQPAMVDYPGGWTTKSAGDALAKIRADALASGARTLRGDSDHRGLAPGHSFTLAGHERGDANVDWVLREVSHEASHTHYANRFIAFPKDVVTRPARLTPRARIHGSQTAIVVGKAGEEIWTDEHGRVKVQFHWDRVGVNDENSSCWVRVAQAWAGKSFGAQFIPRIGQEVVVSFLDGNPDRPLITGSVYNGVNALPYTVPASQTRSGVKTESSKGGAGFNEIRFEDKKDAEELFLQAQKDMKTVVLNDASVQVKQNQKVDVQEGNRTVTVAKGNLTTAVDTGNDTLTVKGTRSVAVDGAETHANKADFTHDADANYTLTIKGNLSIDVTGSVSIKSGTAFNAEAGTALTNKAGTSLTNEAGTSLTNKAGTSLTNDAGLSMTNKAGASQTVDGGGMLTLKAGLVKIN